MRDVLQNQTNKQDVTSHIHSNIDPIPNIRMSTDLIPERDKRTALWTTTHIRIQNVTSKHQPSQLRASASTHVNERGWKEIDDTFSGAATGAGTSSHSSDFHAEWRDENTISPERDYDVIIETEAKLCFEHPTFKILKVLSTSLFDKEERELSTPQNFGIPTTDGNGVLFFFSQDFSTKIAPPWWLKMEGI